MQNQKNGASQEIVNSVRQDSTTHDFAGENEPAAVRGMLYHGHSARSINARIEEALTGLLDRKLGAPGLSCVEIVSRLRSLGANDAAISNVVSKLLKAAFPKAPVYAHRRRQPVKAEGSLQSPAGVRSEAETYLRTVYPCTPEQDVPQVLLIVERLQQEASMLEESTTPAKLVYRAVGIHIAQSLSGVIPHREIPRRVAFTADLWRGIR